MDNMQYLKSKGFTILTGEACGFSMRLLVDVTQDAVEILKSFWGVADITPHPNWNSSSIGSVMLTHSTVWDELIPYMVLLDGADVVYRINDSEFCGRDWNSTTNEKWMESRDKLKRNFDSVDVHFNWASKSRNIHGWTGREE